MRFESMLKQIPQRMGCSVALLRSKSALALHASWMRRSARRVLVQLKLALRLIQAPDRGVVAGVALRLLSAPVILAVASATVIHLPQAYMLQAAMPSGVNSLIVGHAYGLDLRMIAISRLMLDNFQHIKAYWIMLGIPTAQLALSYGADDIDGTVVHEKIYHDAGSDTPQELTVAQLRRLIEEAGRVPVERDTLYHEVIRERGDWQTGRPLALPVVAV